MMSCVKENRDTASYSIGKVAINFEKGGMVSKYGSKNNLEARY